MLSVNLEKFCLLLGQIDSGEGFADPFNCMVLLGITWLTFSIVWSSCLSKADVREVWSFGCMLIAFMHFRCRITVAEGRKE